MRLEELLAQPFGTIPELIRLHAASAPRHPALIQDERSVDFRTLDALMDRIAAAFQRDGLEPNRAIAICAANSIEYAAIFLGALRAGLAVAPLAPSSTPEAIVSMIADAEASHLFVDEAAARALEPVRARIAARMLPIGNPGPWIGDARAPRAVRAKPEDPFNIIYSSGTTGVPKGIVQPNAMRWAHVVRSAVYGYGPAAVTLISTPLYSNTTLVSFFPTIALGGTVVLMAKFDAAGYLALAERHRVTHTMLVPVQYQRIMALPGFGRFDLSAFRAKFSTSAPFSAALKADVIARWPGGLYEYYGMTEGGGTCVLIAHEFPGKLDTVGRAAPGVDIRLIGEDDREVAAGEVGEVVGHSPAMMTGYHKRRDMTSKAEWFDALGRRFIRTGDVGRFDEDGFLVLLDRKKDLVISGGFNVYPSDLEAVLARHPGVADAAVVGVPSKKWGETPVAFVVARTHADLDPERLREWANARLGATQRIAAVELIEALPRSAIGKVLKRELRALHRPRE
ncbi:MAG TPA: class I adenylate-forming enzyme family protein [Usitatibacter sp.]